MRYITIYGMVSDVIKRFDWLISVERKFGGKMIVEFRKWSMVTSKWKQLIRRYTRRRRRIHILSYLKLTVAEVFL